MKPILAIIVCIFAVLAQAQDEPRIKVIKGDKLKIALSGVSGGDAEILKRDLALSGFFAVTAAGEAQYAAGLKGNEGEVTGSDGKVVLRQSYPERGKARIHAFADDIVETITGSPGIASTRIAFVATKTGKKEIYMCDADGGELMQLTKDQSIAVSPSISANGNMLLYTGYQSGYPDVYRIELGSGARNRIMKYPGTNSGACFSPSGGSIAVTLSKDGNPELYITGSGGSGPRRLTRTAGVESSPTWSPDGNELIYSSDEGGSPQLYRISVNGGSPRRLATGHSYNTEPAWSPDGKKLAFNTRSGGGFSIAVMDLSSGEVRMIGEGEDPAWGADSRHVVVAAGGAIVMLDTQSGSRVSIVSGLGRVSEPTWSRR